MAITGSRDGRPSLAGWGRGSWPASPPARLDRSVGQTWSANQLTIRMSDYVPRPSPLRNTHKVRSVAAILDLWSRTDRPVSSDVAVSHANPVNLDVAVMNDGTVNLDPASPVNKQESDHVKMAYLLHGTASLQAVQIPGSNRSGASNSPE